jgi:hypothetical protein
MSSIIPVPPPLPPIGLPIESPRTENISDEATRAIQEKVVFKFCKIFI